MFRNARFSLLAPALLLSGCYGHNFPTAQSFPFAQPLPPQQQKRAQVFVDANGTLYPSGWQALQLTRRPFAGSVLAQTRKDPAGQRTILADEQRQLGELEQFAAGKKRVFILVHGYNNRPSEAENAFDDIEPKLALGPDDGVIWFQWDGLTGKLGGAIPIWFNATGYSQLAGAHGLRRVLNTIANKDVYLISHSRGASVVLSALANPVYDPRFLAQTEAVLVSLGQQPRDYLAPAPLLNRGNRITAIMLAPAVDKIDFCDASQQTTRPVPFECAKFKDLGPQLKALLYTVNPRDEVLRKFVGVAGSFNPTRLGLEGDVGAQLQGSMYPFMHAFEFRQPSKQHPFRAYVAHPCFGEMLQHAGIIPASSSEPAQRSPGASTVC